MVLQKKTLYPDQMPITSYNKSYYKIEIVSFVVYRIIAKNQTVL